MAIKSQIYNDYKKRIIPELQKELELKTIMEVPKIEKIVINMGISKAINDKGIVKEAVEELTKISGQKAIITYARKSNASFKLRAGMPIGVKVTLRGEKMYQFLDKLINISLPRIRDFRGVGHKSFDKGGNYTLGIPEYIVFPEIELDKVKNMKGCDISIIVSTQDQKISYKLLEKFGMPFKNIKREEQ